MEGRSQERSSGAHPPVARLLAFYHRTLESDESRGLLYHIVRCAECRRKLERIEAVATLFRGTKGWRDTCPPSVTLFRYAGSELSDAETRALTEHIHHCYVCRDEFLIFREVRHAARSGHSTFLDPRGWRLRTTYWKRRGYLRWLLTPRLIHYAGRLAFVLLIGLLSLVMWKGIQLELERRSGNRPKQVTTQPRPAEATATRGLERTDATVELPTASRVRYFFGYRNGHDLVILPPTNPESRWASVQIDASRRDQARFRIGEPMQEEGLVVLRPLRALSLDAQEALREQLAQALEGPPRVDARAWSQVRAEIQRSTRGEVWLMKRPTPADLAGSTSTPAKLEPEPVRPASALP